MSAHGEWPICKSINDMVDYLKRNDRDGVLHVAQMLYGNVEIAAIGPGDVVLLVSEENCVEPDVVRRLKELGFERSAAPDPGAVVVSEGTKDRPEVRNRLRALGFEAVCRACGITLAQCECM